ncbi:MAG: hypothetical protein RIT81_36810 [Deltaproteobacteria bacterium]
MADPGTAYAIHREASAGARQACVQHLEKLGVRLEPDIDGAVRGRLWLDIRRLPCIDGIGLVANVEFSCPDYENLVFDEATALCRIPPVPIAGAKTLEALTQRVTRRYEKLAALMESGLRRARNLAPDARVRLSPFRVEGSVMYAGERLLLLFSTKGHRACIYGIDDRPVSFLPAETRVVFDADEGPPAYPHAQWDRGVEQARRCLGAAEVATEEEVQRSMDLVSRDITPEAHDGIDLLPPIEMDVEVSLPIESTAHGESASPSSSLSLDLGSLDLTSNDLP